MLLEEVHSCLPVLFEGELKRPDGSTVDAIRVDHALLRLDLETGFSIRMRWRDCARSEPLDVYGHLHGRMPEQRGNATRWAKPACGPLWSGAEIRVRMVHVWSEYGAAEREAEQPVHEVQITQKLSSDEQIGAIENRWELQQGGLSDADAQFALMALGFDAALSISWRAGGWAYDLRPAQGGGKPEERRVWILTCRSTEGVATSRESPDHREESDRVAGAVSAILSFFCGAATAPVAFEQVAFSTESRRVARTVTAWAQPQGFDPRIGRFNKRWAMVPAGSAHSEPFGAIVERYIASNGRLGSALWFYVSALTFRGDQSTSYLLLMTALEWLKADERDLQHLKLTRPERKAVGEALERALEGLDAGTISNEKREAVRESVRSVLKDLAKRPTFADALKQECRRRQVTYDDLAGVATDPRAQGEAVDPVRFIVQVRNRITHANDDLSHDDLFAAFFKARALVERLLAHALGVPVCPAPDLAQSIPPAGLGGYNPDAGRTLYRYR